jgi:hypothetical protein
MRVGSHHVYPQVKGLIQIIQSRRLEQILTKGIQLQMNYIMFSSDVDNVVHLKDQEMQRNCFNSFKLHSVRWCIISEHWMRKHVEGSSPAIAWDTTAGHKGKHKNLR